jgi:hypothetical protein
MNEGDILIYIDSGVEVNKRGIEKLSYYLDHIEKHGSLIFTLPYQSRFWTKNDARIRPIDSNFRNQAVAGVLGFKVNKQSIDLVDAWASLCSIGGGELLVDGQMKNDPRYQEHRHDQSLFSKVVFDKNVETLPYDDTYFSPWRKGKLIPFLALRNAQSRSLLSIELAPAPLRIIWKILRIFYNPLGTQRIARNLIRSFRSSHGAKNR